MQEKIVVPYAPILIESTRSIGYSFEAAVADIIDNSVSAGATEIRICFMSQDPQWLCIEDDGWGMTADELESAMRYGSQSSQNTRRKNDLGRFGLGLKMASLSQCRKVTVLTKKDGTICAACWDLDYIVQQGNWSLKFFAEDEIKCMHGWPWLDMHDSGTVVIWEHFDRLKQGSSKVQKAFDEKIEITRKHVALVFHRFLSDEGPKNRLSIYFNGETVTGIDPFLTKHPATQPLSEQILRIGTEEIHVKPYVLPYLNKMSKKDLNSIGGKDELRQQQGFYIYRSRRLIIWGTWFRLIKQNELGKLARVRVDIPNSLDSVWEIDIKKSTASLPHFIKKNLADIVENTVGRSERVYKYRGRNVQSDNLIHIWNLIDERGKLQYQINRELPILNMLEYHLDEEGSSLLESFIKMMEDAFPYADVYYRMARSEADITETVLDTNDVYAIADQMIQQAISTEANVGVFLKTIDKMDFFKKYPNVIRQIREVYGND
ncbi:ATP-binding protein [Clostridium sp. AF18-27]|uniref:ATP-binding protein n=1 Tax=Enterocloster lavalensis TaxID=460384 RepID=UPI000E4D7502|nr:ATP-binding protein [Enterocloster lavalensis]RHR56388.1 ATP-binding protein [Clostridium sp. AF18-27]